MTRNEHGPLGKAWTDIGSDVNWADYGGLWARHIEGTRYHVIRFENCREWGDGATGYHVELSEVTLDNPQLESALASNGLTMADMSEIQERGREWAKVSALHSHGAKAPLFQNASANSWALLRAAKRESRLLQRDQSEYSDRMDRPVNAIGTSARNYGLGIIFAADRPAKPVTHWSYGSGMPGCLYDNQGTAETRADAIESALFIFQDDLSEDEYAAARSELESSGLHYFPSERRAELGASLVEVSEQPGPCPTDD